VLTQRLRRLVTALAAQALSTGGGLRLLDAMVPSGGVRVTRDVPYGAGPRRALDIYRPPEPGQDRPLVVFFYGGSWKTGARGAYRFVATTLARRGMVVAVPDYRLYPETVFPGFLEDAAGAVAWATENAARHGAAPRPFLIGHSAGAYIALMLALNPAYLRAAGMDRARLAGVVGIAGPYDFHPSRFPDVAPIFAAAEEAATQPIAYADGANPPLLLLAGGADATVRPTNTLNLAARVAARGGPVATRLYPKLGHIGVLLAFAPLFRRNAPVLADIEQFVRAHRQSSVLESG
jgi:acetyl esterase/lipase